MPEPNSTDLPGRAKKRAALDASSAIILFKAGLHESLAEIYQVVLAGSVYRELTGKPYAGSTEYRQMTAAGKVMVREAAEQSGKPQMPGIDTGEYDTIRLFHTGQGDFIITDDGRAARYCRRNGLPFVNALLIPVILRFARLKDDAFCRRSMDRIAGIGRYSERVVSFAGTCRRESIAFALP